MSKEAEARRLLDLPPCGCGQGLDCPEIRLNSLGHSNEAAVAALLSEKDGGGPWWQEAEMEMEAERFGLLCDYFWRMFHPETPKDDGLLHTSAECRKRAGEVLDLLDLEWWKTAGEGQDGDEGAED